MAFGFRGGQSQRRRAGEPALRGIPAGRRGRGCGVIYLLTDGEFPNNSGRVVETVRHMNAGRWVRIHTILHHHRSPSGVKLLQQIALESAGCFRFVRGRDVRPSASGGRRLDGRGDGRWPTGW